MSEESPGRPAALVLLRRAQHVLFGALLLVAAVRAVAADRHPVVAVLGAVLLGGWYAVGAARARRPGERPGPLAVLVPGPGSWLGVLAGGWIALAVVSPDFGWLAFPLFLLFLQMLPYRAAFAAVAALTAVVVGVFAWHAGRVEVAGVLGPVIGAAVAVVITVVYRDLRDQNEARARLLAELTAARDRLAATERRAGTLAERERVAREVHDTVAQGLSSVLLVLRSARGSLTGESPEARRNVDTALAATRDALTDTRRLIRALAPAELADGSLAEALGRLVERTRAVGLDAVLVVDGDPYALPTPVAVALLRTAQGAVANVREHSGADRVAVTLTFQPGAVALDVADDGRGFDPRRPAGSPTAGTGVGLAAMRERLAEVGGRLVVESVPGSGCAVNASVPRAEESGDD